jgi:hypothetical protein
MAPTLVREPFHRDGWVYEEKVDGWRILAYKAGDRVRLVSRSGVNHARRFSDLAAAVAKFSSRTLVLDGEVGPRPVVPAALRVVEQRACWRHQLSASLSSLGETPWKQL